MRGRFNAAENVTFACKLLSPKEDGTGGARAGKGGYEGSLVDDGLLCCGRRQEKDDLRPAIWCSRGPRRRPSRVKPRIHTLGASVRFKKYAKKDKETGIQISLSDHFATMRG